MNNPYLAEWQSQVQRQQQRLLEEESLLRRDAYDLPALTRLMEFKKPFVRRYAWAIPTDEAIHTLARYSPLIEIGAGTGYWAWLLRQISTNILCFDRIPPISEDHSNSYHAGFQAWTEVLEGDESNVDKYPERTLFLCWPPPKDPMAHRVLSRYAGEVLVYVGELGHPQGLFAKYPVRGSCADEQFEALLANRWTAIKQLDLPNWDGCWSTLNVFRRKIAKSNP